MARTNQSNGTTLSQTLLVISTLLFVISAGMLIVTISQRDEAERERDKVVSELKQYISKEEALSPDLLEIKARPDSHGSSTGTVYHKLQDEINDLKTIIIGYPAPTDTLRSEISALDIDPHKNAYLISEIKSLRSQFHAVPYERSLSRIEYEAKINDMVASRQQLEQSDRKLIDQLQNTLAQQKNQFIEYQAKVDAQTQQLQTDYKKTLEENSETIAQKEKVIENLRSYFGCILRRRPPRTNMPELASKGSILVAGNDQSLVQINRGRLEHVTKGLTFEVYDKTTGIVADIHDRNNLHGKATIEVVGMSEHTADCRVVRLDHESRLVEGDVLGNVVYDPQAHYKFVVFGDFDLYHAGQATSMDRQQIETMITTWGGVLQKAVNNDTDYLVLGEVPLLPDPLPSDTVDPVVLQRHQALLARYEAYMKVLQQALNNGVPVLNQSRFLSLVGFYQR
jgi:hypothetical protein